MPYNLSSGWTIRRGTTGYTGLGLLYGLNYMHDAPMYWCQAEDNHKKELTSTHWKFNPTSFAGTTAIGIEADLFYRCNSGLDNNPTDRFSELTDPRDGFALCGGTKTLTGRISWLEMHKGEGAVIALADGSSGWLSYQKIGKTPNIWENGDYDVNRSTKLVNRASVYYHKRM